MQRFFHLLFTGLKLLIITLFVVELYFAQNRTPYAHLGYRRLKGLTESYTTVISVFSKPSMLPCMPLLPTNSTIKSGRGLSPSRPTIPSS